MGETCAKRTGSAAEHCWHDTGKVLTSYPPQYEQICCFCGEKRNRRSMLTVVDRNHGEYLPSYDGENLSMMAEIEIKQKPKPRYENTVVCSKCFAEYDKDAKFEHGWYLDGTAGDFFTARVTSGCCPVCRTRN